MEALSELILAAERLRALLGRNGLGEIDLPEMSPARLAAAGRGGGSLAGEGGAEGSAAGGYAEPAEGGGARSRYEVLWGARETALSAGELSDIFERDARRYDGGLG